LVTEHAWSGPGKAIGSTKWASGLATKKATQSGREVEFVVTSPHARERDRHARRETNPHLHLLPERVLIQSGRRWRCR